MAKRKFVEDSDEDEEGESPAKLSQSVLNNPQSSHAASAPLINSRSTDTSTASTGKPLNFLRLPFKD